MCNDLKIWRQSRVEYDTRISSAQILKKSGVFYRCHAKDLPGKPDISIKKYKLALDVHGCFWHGHLDCKKSKLPKTNTEFWQNKINQNRARDTRTTELFKEIGFDYFVIWECEFPNLRVVYLHL